MSPCNDNGSTPLRYRLCGGCDHWQRVDQELGECHALPPQLRVERIPGALPWQKQVDVQKFYPPMRYAELGCRALFRLRTSDAVDLEALISSRRAALDSRTDKQTEVRSNEETQGTESTAGD